jgi:hypothetical protein
MNASTLILPLVLLPLAADSAPLKDLIPMGAHRIKFVLSVNASAIGACLCRPCEIREGDTYGEIARRECGDASCAEEIRLLNPEVKDPAKLRSGDHVRIPPRAIGAESRATTRPGGAAVPCWVLFTIQWGRRGQMTPNAILEGEPIEVRGREGLRVVAVPRDQLLEFLGRDWEHAKAGNLPDGTVSSDVIVPTWVLPVEDPTMTIEKRVTLKSSNDRRILFEVEERRFDKRGNELKQEGGPKGASLPLLPVAVIGVSALLTAIGMAWRRRTRIART